MNVEIISRSIFLKVWDRAGIELSTPGSAVRRIGAFPTVLTGPRPPDKSVYWKIIFFISHPKHMLWVLKRTVSMRQFF